MIDSHAVGTLMVPGLCLPIIDLMPPKMHDILYCSTISKLSYLAHTSQPDITYTVNYLSQFSNTYNNKHWSAVKHLLRYLCGTCDLALSY
jgi:hypothetical protein